MPHPAYRAGMRVAILDYQAGNATSVLQAVRTAAPQVEASIVSSGADLAAADRIIFPGVGAAGSCMANLRSAGFADALRAAVDAGKPVLSICIGLQLLFASSDEDGGTPCLGLLPGTVVRFTPRPGLKIPHMGWSPVTFIDEPLADGIPPGSHFYFVHSYHAVPAPGVRVIATGEHGATFCAGVRHGSLVAFQFHPEKSGPAGLRLISNFLR